MVDSLFAIEYSEIDFFFRLKMDAFGQNYGEEIQVVLCKGLEEISVEKQYYEKCLSIVVHALQSFKEQSSVDRQNADTDRVRLFSRFQSMLSSTLMTTLPQHFPGILIFDSFFVVDF